MKYQNLTGCMIAIIFFCCIQLSVFAQSGNIGLSFTVSMKQPSTQQFHVVFTCSGIKKDSIEFKLPNWMPGYYQLLNYADNIQNFTASGLKGEKLHWHKTAANAWKVAIAKSSCILSYDVTAKISFVAQSYMDENRAFIAPPAVFLYPAGYINHAVSITIEPYPKWATIATGLDLKKGKPHTYYAASYDVLFDSPILTGNLETFPSFTVNNIPHYFVAFKPDSFDRAHFMQDLKKIATAATAIIGDIPFKRYVFTGIGPGGGGIEHLNSAAVAFTGNELNDAKKRIRTYNFLAHEYFHLYNVKRIRPVELGPFDYDNGNRTKMLWLSEGITVYYEYIILKRAGLTNRQQLLDAFQSSIKEYETKPGRHFQTPAEASYTTWEDGPFGRTSDEVNKTISPYDKGPALGLLLDFKIRHETKNKKSLDDLMRLLYHNYYQLKNRGFTEDEFRAAAEQTAGSSLQDFFEYIYTLKTVDYPTYLGYAGLAIDTTTHDMSTAWPGIDVRDKNDTLRVNNVEWPSAAWQSGLRKNAAILQVNGKKATASAWQEALSTAKPGDSIHLVFTCKEGTKDESIILSSKKENTYTITVIDKPDALQKAILSSWMGEK